MKIANFLDKNKTDEKKVCKGLKKSGIKKQLTYADYKKCLKQAVVIYKSFKKFKIKESQNSNLFSKKNRVVGDGFQKIYFELWISHFIARKLSYC